jgi:hypothetical protein
MRGKKLSCILIPGNRRRWIAGLPSNFILLGKHRAVGDWIGNQVARNSPYSQQDWIFCCSVCWGFSKIALVPLHARHTLCYTPYEVCFSLWLYRNWEIRHCFCFTSLRLVYLEVNLFSYYTRNSERYTDKIYKLMAVSSGNCDWNVVDKSKIREGERQREKFLKYDSSHVLWVWDY